MSLVGSRSPIFRELIQYNNYARQRIVTKTGLTSSWKVNHNRHYIPSCDWVALDIKYTEEHSYLLYLKLIIRTVFVVFSYKVI